MVCFENIFEKEKEKKNETKLNTVVPAVSFPNIAFLETRQT
jgi:hypothetical protein